MDVSSGSNSGTGQTTDEVMPNQNGALRYFVINPYYSCLDELVQYNMEFLVHNPVLIAYSGESMIPMPGEVVSIIPTNLGEAIWTSSFDEILEVIKGYEVAETIQIPYVDYETFISKYATTLGLTPMTPVAPNPENPAGPGFVQTVPSLVVGSTLAELIDLSAYESLIPMLEDTWDYELNLNDILPFDTYRVDNDLELVKEMDVTVTDKLMLSGAIPGMIGSIMIVKMDNASTYDLIEKIPYDENAFTCSFDDLGNYRVIATNLTERQVENMVAPNRSLNYGYRLLSYIVQKEAEEAREAEVNNAYAGYTEDEILDLRRELIENGALCSTGIPGTINGHIINYMRAEYWLPEEYLDFSYDEWIDASNFVNCEDEGMLWALSIADNHIGGGLLDVGKLLSEDEFNKLLGVDSLPVTDVVAIINEEELKFCFVARVNNETYDVERANATNVSTFFFRYFDRLQRELYKVQKSDPGRIEDYAKSMSIGVYAVGPYVWVTCLSDNQGFDEHFTAEGYHFSENEILRMRLDSLFCYLRIASLEDKELGFDISKNRWY